ncbi:amidohydrolase [Dethiosulfatarculus sandiegensis]|uniref:Peptidase M20 domain-containing protein 2 n=1 Tax=Dethiosulfatarculus sandiegensis TaxID=1429043 RepID=A0A0D2JD69_9BACT|nr:amidohydrolase [Dethiosulfatarculus sandiegensis]KIX13686.1 amidohydrolase [Dethiosulfatarculus sandiegensis]
MDKNALKQKIFSAIEDRKQEIKDLSLYLWDHPELGYKEKEGTKKVAEFLGNLGLETTENLAVTGCQAQLEGKEPGKVVAVMGELDAIVCPDHECCDKETKAVHACGHHLQVGVMAGVALGLAASGVMDQLTGSVRFMAVPAEEFIELSFRSGLRQEGSIRYFGGKQELIAKGYLDDVDLAVMMHALSLSDNGKVLIGPKGNGFVGKEVRFIGQESHAGSAPEDGVNALNAAMIGLSAIHAQRETFKDEDRVRVHPMITKGGDIVNVVPADVRLESYTRARTVEAMVDANQKVDRALKAGALAVGAQVEIKDTCGYLPLLTNPDLDALTRQNALELVGEEAITDGGDFTGSFDFGDVSHLMPSLHPFIGGVKGALHTRDFEVTDFDTALIMPAKLLAATLVDLLADGGKEADRITEAFVPVLSKEEYIALLEDLTKTTTFK